MVAPLVTVLLAAVAGRWTGAQNRSDPAYEQAARSLGAGEARVLLRVRLTGLAGALSMGELGATIMVYPPGLADAAGHHLRPQRPGRCVPGQRQHRRAARGHRGAALRAQRDPVPRRTALTRELTP
jgi:hypothetical protein